MSQAGFLQDCSHTKLIVAFASDQICEYLGKSGKNSHFGAIGAGIKKRQVVF